MRGVAVQFYRTQRREQPSRLVAVLKATARLIVPVTSLVGILWLAYQGLQHQVTAFDVFGPDLWMWNPGYWLTEGHLILAFAFLAVNLTNRRYGGAYAFAQVVIGWVVIGIIGYFAERHLGPSLGASALPALESMLFFAIAFLTAQIVNVEIFDKIRGRTWWGAPLFSVLWASLVFVAIYYPLTSAGQGVPWIERAVADFAIKAVLAVVMLVPYYVMRPLIRPLPGFGGA